MSNGTVNRVILIGNAGGDAEVRYMPSGSAVANVSLATTESWRDRQSGQMQERTEWHNLVFMDRGNFKMGENAGKMIKKGSKVYIDGSLRTRAWEKDGVKRYTTEVVVNEFQMLDNRSESQPQPDPSYDEYAQSYDTPQVPAPQQPAPQQPAPQQPAPAQPAEQGGKVYQSFGSWTDVPQTPQQ